MHHAVSIMQMFMQLIPIDVEEHRGLVSQEALTLHACAAAGKMDEEYNTFLAELGGGPGGGGNASGPGPDSRSGGGGFGGGGFGGGGGGGGGFGRQRPGDDLPDNCKLYVGNLGAAVNDAVLKQVLICSNSLVLPLCLSHEARP